MPIYVIELAMGVAMLLGGNELLTRGAAHFSPLFNRIAATYGAGAAALIVSFQASATGSPDLALGAIFGGALWGIVLLLVLRRGKAPRFAMRSMLAALVALVLFCLDEEIDRAEALVLLGGMAAYGWFMHASATETPRNDKTLKDCRWCACAYMLTGLGLLFTGGDIFIDGALSAGQTAGMQEALTGLTLVAIATTIPAALARQGAFSHLSRNVFILLGVTGISALLTPIRVSSLFLQGELWVLVALFAAYTIYQSRTLH